MAEYVARSSVLGDLHEIVEYVDGKPRPVRGGAIRSARKGTFDVLGELTLPVEVDRLKARNEKLQTAARDLLRRSKAFLGAAPLNDPLREAWSAMAALVEEEPD